MTIEGLELIKKYEGCNLKAYKCPAGVLTIGYGNTRYLNGEPVREGDVITQEEADALFKKTLDNFEYQVKLIIGDRLKTILPESAISALVSLAYNIGITAFGKSTLLKVIKQNKNNLRDIEFQWLRWNKAGGVILNGLTKRREEEFAIYKRAVLNQYTVNEREKFFKCNYI
jgi:lysozyme